MRAQLYQEADFLNFCLPTQDYRIGGVPMVSCSHLILGLLPLTYEAALAERYRLDVFAKDHSL